MRHVTKETFLNKGKYQASIDDSVRSLRGPALLFEGGVAFFQQAHRLIFS